MFDYQYGSHPSPSHVQGFSLDDGLPILPVHRIQAQPSPIFAPVLVLSVHAPSNCPNYFSTFQCGIEVGRLARFFNLSLVSSVPSFCSCCSLTFILLSFAFFLFRPFYYKDILLKFCHQRGNNII